MMYRIYVTLKNGNQATGLELYKGSPPASGTELEVPLMRGGSVQARIGKTTNTKRIGGVSVSVVAEVHADEIQGQPKERESKGDSVPAKKQPLASTKKDNFQYLESSGSVVTALSRARYRFFDLALTEDQS